MKYITDRKAIAKAFASLPIIKIDMENHIDGYDTLFEGEKVKVKMSRDTYVNVVGNIIYSAESKKFYVQNCGAMLSGSFSYSDVMELYEKNHAPTVAEDVEVGILEVYPKAKQCRIRVMKTKYCNLMTMEACVFEDVE